MSTPSQLAAAEVAAVIAANTADLVVINTLQTTVAAAFTAVVNDLTAAVANLSDGSNQAALQAVASQITGAEGMFLTLKSNIVAATTNPPIV